MSSTNDKRLIAFVGCLQDVITLTTVDSKIGKVMTKRSEIGGCRKFISQIPRLFKNVRSVILNVFSIEPSNYPSNYEFCKEIKEVLDRLKLSYCFVCDYQSMCSLLLTAADVDVKLGENVIIILVNKTGHTVMQLQFDKDGWNSIGSTHFQYDPNQSFESLRSKIMGKLQPKQIIVSACDRKYPFMQNLNSILKFKDITVFAEDLLPYNGRYAVETEKWMKDKSFVKFYVIPQCVKSYCIGLKTGIKSYDLVYVEHLEKLPCTKERFYQKDDFKLNLFSRNYHTGKDHVIEEITLDMNVAHRYKLIVSVDSDNFPSYKIEPIILPSIKNMLPSMISGYGNTSPVIGFYGNSSVICYWDKTEYKFLERWNGMFGKQLYISFDQKKPAFMEDAVEALRTKPSYVILDLIRIMAMPVDKVVNYGPWNFKFTKDADNAVLIEFDKFGKGRAAASPAFLMAMLLKEHLKVLKEELGEKPDRVIFCLLDNYDMDTRIRIQDVFGEACKLLKIETVFRTYLYISRD